MTAAYCTPLRLLITGANGQVGHELTRQANELGHQVTAVDLDQLDITDQRAVEEAVATSQPAWVINAAAYTAVDRAESDRETAYAVNRDGTTHLATACHRHGIPMLHISTDYVFDGSKDAPYAEDDEAVPLSVYGSSKLAGEISLREQLQRHLILRTSWVFGLEGNNFVKTILRLASERDRLSIVDDQRGCPTSAKAIAGTCMAMVSQAASTEFQDWGTYHYCDRPETSWYGFAREIIHCAEVAGMLTHHIKLRPIATSEYPAPARRPRYTVLDTRKIRRVFGIEGGNWTQELAETIRLLGQTSRATA